MAGGGNGNSVIAIRDLRHEIDGRVVLDLPSLTVTRGGHTLVLGRSGSGKTTLINIIAGILRPTAGQVALAGHDLGGMNAAALDALRGRHVGIVFQTLHLIAALTVRQNLRLTRRLAGMPGDEAHIDAVLDALNIRSLADRYPRALSHGEAQRAAIARAVINAPDVILADEPTSALDDGNCKAVHELLTRQADENGATLLIATHDRRLADVVDNRFELDART
jgi:putative ABC transport system ATP-binding protein